MSSQQMHDYINEQLQQGIPQEQIRQNLIANGWPAQEIDNYFLSLANQTTSQTQPSIRQKYIKFIIPVVVILLVVGAGLAYSFNQRRSSENQVTEQTVPSPQAETTPTDSVAPMNITLSPQEVEPKVNTLFEEKLSTCTPTKESFQHELTGETMEKEIVGEVDGKCLYVEQMPNGGKMECHYTESERRAIAQYYLDVKAAESTTAHVKTDGTNTTTEYSIDGKVVENPLAEAVTNGTCVVSGY